MPQPPDRFLYPAALGIAAPVVLGPGCGGDKETSAEPGPPPPLVAGTVDAGGGQLVHDCVVLTVPAGALAGATELAIYREDEGHPFGVAGAPVYRLTGLPSEFGAPMELRILHGFDFGAEDTLTLFLGEEREGYDCDKGVSWEIAAALDSAGWCVAALERGALGLGARQSGDLRAAVAEDAQVLKHTAGHFQIIFRTSEVAYEDAANALGTFESAYQGTLLMGFQYEQPDRVFPLDIYARVPAVSTACYISGPYGKGHFDIEPDLIAPDVLLMPVAAHEVLHSAQTFYDPRPPEQWATLKEERLWLDEATAAYIEVLAEGSDNYFPMGMDADRYLAPLRGLAGCPDLAPDEYGNGMASFIKYLVEARFAGQGTDRILELFEHFKTGGDVTDAIDTVVDPPVAAWCVDLHRQLVEGRIYHLDPEGVIWSSWPLAPGVSCGVGATASDRVTVPDLGAGILKFPVIVDDPDTLTALSVRASVVAGGQPGVRADETLPLTVYGFLSGALPVRLAVGTDSLIVGDWLEVLGNYQYILVMVSRPYSTAPGHTGQVEVKVDVEVVLDTNAIDVTAFTDVVIEVRTDNMYNWGGPLINELIGISSDVAWQGDGFYAYSAEDTFAST